MRIAIRGFVGRTKQFEDRIEVEPETMKTKLPSLVDKRFAAMHAHGPHMIEVEFLDHPGNDRFFRFGTDRSAMVWPKG